MEKKLGAPIFDRSTSPPGLTQCGERYIRCVERLMDMENEFGNYLNDLEGLRAGHLAIGGSNLFTSYILPPILQRFMKDYPGVEVNLVESNTKQLERQLLSGSLDLVIDNYLFSESIYERKKFSAEHLLLAVPRPMLAGKEEALAGAMLDAAGVRAGRHLPETWPAVDLGWFEEEPFLLLKPGNDTRGAVGDAAGGSRHPASPDSAGSGPADDRLPPGLLRHGNRLCHRHADPQRAVGFPHRLFLPEGKRQPAEYLFLLQAQPLHDPGHGDFFKPVRHRAVSRPMPYLKGII